MPPAARGLFADRHQQWREAQALELHTGFVGFGAAFKGAEVNTGFGMGFYTGFFELGDQLFGIAGTAKYAKLDAIPCRAAIRQGDFWLKGLGARAFFGGSGDWGGGRGSSYRFGRGGNRCGRRRGFGGRRRFDRRCGLRRLGFFGGSCCDSWGRGGGGCRWCGGGFGRGRWGACRSGGWGGCFGRCWHRGGSRLGRGNRCGSRCSWCWHRFVLRCWRGGGGLDRQGGSGFVGFFLADHVWRGRGGSLFCWWGGDVCVFDFARGRGRGHHGVRLRHRRRAGGVVKHRYRRQGDHQARCGNAELLFEGRAQVGQCPCAGGGGFGRLGGGAGFGALFGFGLIVHDCLG